MTSDLIYVRIYVNSKSNSFGSEELHTYTTEKDQELLKTIDYKLKEQYTIQKPEKMTVPFFRIMSMKKIDCPGYGHGSTNLTCCAIHCEMAEIDSIQTSDEIILKQFLSKHSKIFLEN
jgi:hypothetical protein